MSISFCLNRRLLGLFEYDHTYNSPYSSLLVEVIIRYLICPKSKLKTQMKISLKRRDKFKRTAWLNNIKQTES